MLLPLAALAWVTGQAGWDSFKTAVTAPDAVAAIKLTLVVSLLVVLINGVFGTLVAWVMVRDEFRGKAFINSLIDLPFALPTIVAGLTLLTLYGPNSPIGVNLAYTRTAVLLALLFETLPFVIRSVQPVLLEIDREVEDAAGSLGANRFTVFRRVILPATSARHRLGCRAGICPGDRRVRLSRFDVGQHPVLDRGRLGAHLCPDPER